MPPTEDLGDILFFTPFPRVYVKKLVLLFGVMCVVGCATVVSKDSVSLQNAIDLKVESLALLDKAVDPPERHSTQIEDLRLKLLKAFEYEKTRGELNAVSIEQWKILIDPNGHLLGGFLRKWETDGIGRSPAFLSGVKKTITQAFDQIIKLESQKPDRRVI